MAKSDSFYIGREQTQVKHFVLQRYLTEMAFKVAQSRKKELTAINYVDGFSGPWETKDEIGHLDTSFGRAIEVLQTVRRELQRVRHARLPVRFVFCEENRVRHKNLIQAVSENQDVEIHCIHGRFEDKLNEISDLCHDGFTFSFIDPTGFKLHTDRISKFLRLQRGEFMWNYMADHANRFVTRKGLEDAYGTLLANKNWANRFEDPDLAGLKNEQRILAVLRERLKDLGCARYVLDFPVMRPREDRVQYRILFGTRRAIGVVVFRAVQKKGEEFQAKRREKLKQNKTGALLLSPEMHAESFLADKGIDGFIPKRSARIRIAAYIGKNGPMSFGELLAPVLETERLTESGLKDVLVQMRKDSLVAYELPPRKRKPQGDVIISLCSSPRDLA